MLRRKVNIKKILLLLIGGLLIMTAITGCSSKPSDKEIEGKFGDFVSMFPIEDLTVLYDKDSSGSVLEVDDLGTWVVSSYLDTSDEDKSKTSGVVLEFNRNTKQVKGTFHVRLYKDKELREDMEYPIYYNKDGLHFSDENVEESLVKELSSFKMMYEFISIGREYLNTLESIDFYYNGEVPLYGATYKLTAEDKNIKNIKELYPDIAIDENNLKLDLEGHGTLWRTTGYVTLNIFLDDKHNNYFTASMSMKDSEEFNKITRGE